MELNQQSPCSGGVEVAPECADQCPSDSLKTRSEVCGCGSPDTDPDSDGTADCKDLCSNDPGKTQAGICGCGISEKDSDNDGTVNCNDLCPTDPNKTEPRDCGCGVAEGTCGCSDTDGGVNQYQKGIVTKDGTHHPDYCVGTKLVEYGCSNGNLRSSIIQCKNACSNGACDNGSKSLLSKEAVSAFSNK